MAQAHYTALADAVLLLHFAVVVFVVGGLPAIVLGHRLGWAWADGWPFRLAHAAAIAVVCLQAWLGRLCPLTVLESWLRVQAGGPGLGGQSFVQHWVSRILYVDAPLWALAVLYTAFGALVALAWWRCPPRGWRRRG